MTGRGAQVQIEGYIDVEPVGSGGLGDVYRARRESTGVVVAIKVLRHVDDESLSWRRTQRELEALAALAGHGHVIGVLEVLPVGSAGRALVMEYAEGGSVAELLQRRGDELSVAETVLIGTHTASALEAAHERGIIHRDVKPQNLLIDRYGQVKLCDFGVASLLRSEQFRDRTSALSARYASPEDLEDDDEVGPPTDVYSLGATLLHLSRGAPPTMTERLTRWTPPADEADADRAGLDGLIEWCLEPDPMSRPTAAALHAALDELSGQLADRVRALGVVDDVIEADDLVVASGDAALDAPTELRNSAVSEPAAPLPPPRPSGDPETDRSAVLLLVAAVLLALFVGFGVWRLLADDEPAITATATTQAVPASTVTAVPTVAATAITTEPAPTTAAAGPTTIATATPTVPVVTVATANRPAHVADLDRYEFPPLERGQCVAASSGTEIAVVDCAQPHDAQYVGGGSLDGFTADAAYDDATVADTTAARCRTARERFLADGVAELPGGLELRMLYQYPSADTWPDGDRTFQCWIASPTSRIIGDVRATG